MNQCLKLITERRSITFFDPSRDVSLELIKEILEVSATAPSGYNLQPWQVVVIMDKEKKKLLREICYGQKKVEDASANIVIIANTKAGFENVDRVLDSWVELGYIQSSVKESLKRSIEAGWNDPQRAKKKAVRDSALFAMNLMITARAYGLETHPMEGYDEAKLREFLNLEDHQEPVMIIAIGYKDPNQDLLPRAYRFKFEEFGRLI
ncbi:nitroreductase family protein [Thermocrinis sp.]